MAILTDAELLALGIGVDSLTGIDSTVRDAHREDASEWVLSFVRPRYEDALAADYVAPASLKGAAATRATMTLFAHRGVSNRDPTYIIVRDRLADVAKWLEEILAGSVQLGEGPTRRAPVIVSTPSTWGLSRSGLSDACRCYGWGTCARCTL